MFLKFRLLRVCLSDCGKIWFWRVIFVLVKFEVTDVEEIVEYLFKTMKKRY